MRVVVLQAGELGVAVEEEERGRSVGAVEVHDRLALGQHLHRLEKVSSVRVAQEEIERAAAHHRHDVAARGGWWTREAGGMRG